VFSLISFVPVVNALVESLLLILVSVIVGEPLCPEAADAVDKTIIKTKIRAADIKTTECNFMSAFIYPTPLHPFIFHLNYVNGLNLATLKYMVPLTKKL
jgi:hypothetical protein